MARDEETGRLTVDRALVVRSWDAWLAEATGIPADAACGHPLAALFPEVEARGLAARLRRVAEEGAVEVLAPAFHQYLIPCAPRGPAGHFAHMQQHVTLSPLRVDGEIVGVSAVIRDVTARREGERRIADRLRGASEEARLGALDALAAAGASADVLVDAFADPSWRVRDAAVGAVVRHGGEGVVEVLTRVLREQHRDPPVLNATLSALAGSGEDVVPPLLALLESPDADLRLYVALALGLRGDPRAAPALERALDDADANVRFHAVEALGRLGARAAAPRLAEIAESRDFFLSFAALDALAAIGDETVARRILPLVDDELLRPAALGALGRLGGEEVVAALAALLERGEVPAAEVAGALSAIHDRYQDGFGDGDGIARLARAVVHPAGAARLAAALAEASSADAAVLACVLSWLPGAGGEEALAGALSDPGARAAAVEGLVRRGARAADALLPRLAGLDEEALRAAVLALGRIGSPIAVPGLLALLDSSPEAAVGIAGALGAIGDARAFEPLLGLLDHARAQVRHAAIGALASIGHPGLRARVAELLASPSPALRESAARIAGYVGYPECADPLLALCRDADEGVRRAAVEHAANLDDPRAAAVLREVLRGDTPACRAAAARAAGRLPPDQAAALLAEALADGDLWVRYYAARAAAAAGAARLAAALAERARRDPAVPVRIAALQALAELGGAPAVPALAALADDPEPEVRLAALAALGGADHPEALRVLRAALRADDAEARRTVLESVEGAAPALAADLAAVARAERDPVMARGAVFALLRAASPEAVRLLAALAAGPALRDACVQALARLPADRLEILAEGLRTGRGEAREAILDALGHARGAAAERLAAGALDDPSPAVRRAAELALARLDLRAAADDAGHA